MNPTINILPYRSDVSLGTLSTMLRHSCLDPVSRSISVADMPPPQLLASPSTNLILGRPLPRLPSTFPIRHRLSSCCSLMVWPRNRSGLCLMVVIIILFAPALWSTCSLEMWSTHGILSILRYNHISRASMRLSITLLIFQASLPYRNVDHAYALTNLFLNPTDMLVFVTKFFT